IALSIVLGRLTSIRVPIGGIEGVRIGFGGLPVIFSGIVLGPLAGAIVGGIGDLIGFWINPMGLYMPHFSITAALTGLIPGLLLRSLKKSQYTFLQLVLAISIGQIITSILLVPYFLQKFFSVPMIASLPANLVNQAIHVPLYASL